MPGASSTRIYTSPADAFPGVMPRPLAPHMTLRGFDVPDTAATHVRLVTLQNQCTGQQQFRGEQDNDPLNATDCVAASTKEEAVRAAEFQVFSAGGEGGGGSGTPQDPFVAFTKTGPVTADQGQTITYKLDYTNLGPAPSEQAKIVDKLPAGVTFVSATGPDTYNSTNRTVTWNLGTVPVLADGTVQVTVRVQPGVATGTLLTNTAEFSGALTIATPALAGTLVL